MAGLVKVTAARSPWLATTLTSRVGQLDEEHLNALIADRWDATLSTSALRDLMSRPNSVLADEALDRVLASDDDEMLKVLFARLGQGAALDQAVVGRVTELDSKNDRQKELLRRAAFAALGVDKAQIDPPNLDNVDAWEALSWDASAGHEAVARSILDGPALRWESELDEKYEVVRRFLNGRLSIAAARYLVAVADGHPDPADVARIRMALQQRTQLTAEPLAVIFARSRTRRMRSCSPLSPRNFTEPTQRSSSNRRSDTADWRWRET